MNAQAPSFAINYQQFTVINSVAIGSYETVSNVYFANNGSTSGPFDFECDLDDLSGNFKQVIGKSCGWTISPGYRNTNPITFNSSSTDASPINVPCGNYEIVFVVSNECNGSCATQPLSCSSDVASGGYTLPYPVTVSCACSGWYTSPTTSANILAQGGSGSFYIYVSSGSGCNYTIQSSSWITASGAGSTISYNVTANTTCSTRTGSITFYDASSNLVATYTITQDGATVPSPPTSVSASTQTYCAGGGGSVTLQLTGPSLPNGASWVWYANSCGGTQVGMGTNVFNIIPTQTTTYYARAEGACGNSTCLSTTVVYVTQVQASNPTASPNPVCTGQTFTLAATSTGPPYEWYYNTSTYLGNSQSITENITTYGAGNYCYTYTANGCQSSQGCVTVSVASPPTITFTQGGQIYLCSSGANSSSIIQALGAQTYVWSPSTGLSSTTVSNPIVSNLTTTTMYTVTGTGNGCTASNSVNVNVTTSPPANTSITPPATTICTGGIGTTLTVSGTAQSYSWSPSNGLSSTNTQNVTANPSSTTTYTVTVSNGSNISCSVTASSTVTVSTSPTASISQSNCTLTAAPSGSGYSWSGPNGFSANTNTNSVIVSHNGNYNVTITDAGGCGTSATAAATVVTCAVGIEEIQAINNLSISPNPSIGSFTLSFDANQGANIQIQIYDLVGQLIQAEEPVIVSGSYSKQINLDNVAKGVYILQIRAGDEIENRKIEVQ